MFFHVGDQFSCHCFLRRLPFPLRSLLVWFSWTDHIHVASSLGSILYWSPCVYVPASSSLGWLLQLLDVLWSRRGRCLQLCSSLSDSFWQFKVLFNIQISSVSQSCLTLRSHEFQHARVPCPSQTPGVHSDSRPSSRWCHPAISSSLVPFSSCPQSALESFPVSQLFTWGGQRTGVQP